MIKELWTVECICPGCGNEIEVKEEVYNRVIKEDDNPLFICDECFRLLEETIH